MLSYSSTIHKVMNYLTNDPIINNAIRTKYRGDAFKKVIALSAKRSYHARGLAQGIQSVKATKRHDLPLLPLVDTKQALSQIVRVRNSAVVQEQ